MITLRGTLTAASAATLAAGATGVLRQRAESGRVRRGALPPASAASDLPPARPPGAIGGHVATWQPARPRTWTGRVAAAIWAAPLTVPGLVLAGLGGRVPRWDATHGCFVATGIGGPSRIALDAVGADANTVGQVVIARRTELSPALLAHEVAHVRQGERLGATLLPAYLWLAARYGYRDHPLERAARASAAEALTSSGP